MAARTPPARRRLIRWTGVVGLLGLVALVPSMVGNESLGANPGDILAFWASSRALLDGLNPYDPAVLEKILATANEALVAAPEVYYPPWLFTVIFWFGLVNAQAFATLWLFLSLVAFIGSSYVAIGYFRDTRTPTAGRAQPLIRWIPYLFVASFYPFLLSLDLGQITPVALVGLVGFITMRHRTDQRSQVLAGLALVAAAIKPHLIYLVFVDFAITEIRRRRWSALGGFAGGFVVVSIVPIFLAPDIYSLFLSQDGGRTFLWFTPTIGAWLEQLLSVEAPAVQLAPTVIALAVVLVAAFRKPPRESRESSDQRLIVLIAVSLLTAPYLWSYDFMLLLPVGLWIIAHHQRGFTLGGVAVAAPLLIVANIAMTAGTRAMQYHLWYPALFLILVVLIRNTSAGSGDQTDPIPLDVALDSPRV